MWFHVFSAAMARGFGFAVLEYVWTLHLCPESCIRSRLCEEKRLWPRYVQATFSEAFELRAASGLSTQPLAESLVEWSIKNYKIEEKVIERHQNFTIFKLFQKLMILIFRAPKIARRGVEHTRIFFRIDFEAFKKILKCSKNFTEIRCSKSRSGLPNAFSFLHMTLIYTIRGTWGCHGGP